MKVRRYNVTIQHGGLQSWGWVISLELLQVINSIQGLLPYGKTKEFESSEGREECNIGGRESKEILV
jgi:hypothetical protein